jgi:general stress protein 26
MAKWFRPEPNALRLEPVAPHLLHPLTPFVHLCTAVDGHPSAVVHLQEATMSEYKTDAQKRQKLHELINNIGVAMMTTVAPDGELHARPMGTAELRESDDVLWFATDRNTGKIDELRQHPQVCLSYAKPGDNQWVSVSGRATVVDDRAKIKDLWTPLWKAWFPKGADDPAIILIKVDPTTAEYWDTDANRLVILFGAAKAALTGERFTPGENQTMKL